LSICPSRPAIPFAFATIALSGSVDAERLRRGRERLALLGTHIDDEIDATAQWRYFAGDDGQRLTSLHRALASEADVVLFARGGYGLSRLLDRIDWSDVAASRKVFCGYSDVTAFSLAALARANYVTFAGPVTAGEFAQTENEDARNFAERHFVALLSSDRYVYPTATSDVDHGNGAVRGTLWGTNLAMITHLVGTPFMPQIDDGILLLEDIGEAPYRVERMFWQLKHAGILDRQRAIILGAFTDCEPAAGMRYPYSLVEAIETLREIAPCPVLTGFPFGHIPAKVTLPMGAPAEIAISGTQYTLSVRDYFSR